MSEEKIPASMASTFAALTTLTDAFCARHLNEECQLLIRKVLAVLARKRPSPLLKGKASSWAAGTVHAISLCNFLFDSAKTPHCNPKIIREFFGVAESTCQGKSKEIRDMLKMGYFDHKWKLPSRLESSSMIWTLRVNGFYVDIRTMPIEAQEQAFAQGLIPYIPALQQDEH